MLVDPQLKTELLAFRKEIDMELNAILSFWHHYAMDQRNDGFWGGINNQNQPIEKAGKGCVLNARILWTFSSAYLHNPEPVYLQMAERAYNYLSLHFLDEKFGGVYWELTPEGLPLNTKKQIYALAFSIYGCCRYYQITKEPSALKLALDLYGAIEAHSYDPIYGGYFEAFSRDWQEASDLRLSEKDANEKKTMNTHLHILEAYSGLYTIFPNEALKVKIELLLRLFADKILNHETYHLNLFFNEAWRSRSQTISYGHDIEASWLLLEAAEVIGNDALIKEMQMLAVQMAHTVREGIRKDGSLIYEFEPLSGKTDLERQWWVEAEAMVGYFNVWSLRPDDPSSLKTSLDLWHYIQLNIKDSVNGEWFWGRNENGTVVEKDKVGFWKCPYHNTRACLEIVKRIDRLL